MLIIPPNNCKKENTASTVMQFENEHKRKNVTNIREGLRDISIYFNNIGLKFYMAHGRGHISTYRISLVKIIVLAR